MLAAPSGSPCDAQPRGAPRDPCDRCRARGARGAESGAGHRPPSPRRPQLPRRAHRQTRGPHDLWRSRKSLRPIVTQHHARPVRSAASPRVESGGSDSRIVSGSERVRRGLRSVWTPATSHAACGPPSDAPATAGNVPPRCCLPGLCPRGGDLCSALSPGVPRPSPARLPGSAWPLLSSRATFPFYLMVISLLPLSFRDSGGFKHGSRVPSFYTAPATSQLPCSHFF